MRKILHRTVTASIAFAAITALALTGCTTSPSSGTASSSDKGTVSIYGPWSGSEATQIQATWAAWSKSNGITIKYSGDANFAQNIATKIQGNSLPNIAFFPQPGLLDSAIKSGKIVVADATTKANVDKNFSADWQSYIESNGKLYGTPLDANVKGYIWYSPAQFKLWGVSVPTTWAELLTLTATIQQKTGKAPWCAGFNSGQASGWPGADWLADMVLRTAGPTVYNNWVAGKVKFTDPAISTAMSDLSQVLLNPKYVNAGFGNVASVNATAFGDVAAPLANGTCAMTHQANFLEADFGAVKTAAGGIPTVGPNGDVWAFMLPSVTAGKGQSVTGGGDFAAAFDSNASTTKVMNYLSSSAWADKLVGAKGSSFISADKGVNVALVTDPLLKSATETLQNPEAVETAFWKGMVDWVNGGTQTAAQQEMQAAWATN
jgi:alpha-glucoside transport system substrate-binding protein